VAEVVEFLPCKHKALSSNSSIAERKKKKKKRKNIGELSQAVALSYSGGQE
jgi:hypothetical protein